MEEDNLDLYVESLTNEFREPESNDIYADVLPEKSKTTETRSNDGVAGAPSAEFPLGMPANFNGRRIGVLFGNLTWWTTDQDLIEFVQTNAGVTDLIDVKIYENRANGQSKGFAVVYVATDASARSMIDKLSSKALHGQNAMVMFASRNNMIQYGLYTQKTGDNERSDRDRNGPSGGRDQHDNRGSGNNNRDDRSGDRQQFNRRRQDDRREGDRNRRNSGSGSNTDAAGMGLMGSRPAPHITSPGQPQMQIPMLTVPSTATLPPGFMFPPPVTIRAGLATAPSFGSAPPGFGTAMIRQDLGGARPGAPPFAFISELRRPPFSLGPSALAPSSGLDQLTLIPTSMGVGQLPVSSVAGSMTGTMAAQVQLPPPAAHLNPAFFPHGATLPQLTTTQPPMDPYTGGIMYPKQDSMNHHGVSEVEFEEILQRNKTVSSSAISRAVQDASIGDYASAIETLVTAISLIKQSKIANDDRCKILISSLQDTLRGIEDKSYGASAVSSSSSRRRTSRSRSRDRSDRRRLEGDMGGSGVSGSSGGGSATARRSSRGRDESSRHADSRYASSSSSRDRGERSRRY